MLGWDPLKHRIMVQEVDKEERCQKSGTEVWFGCAVTNFQWWNQNQIDQICHFHHMPEAKTSMLIFLIFLAAYDINGLRLVP